MLDKTRKNIPSLFTSRYKSAIEFFWEPGRNLVSKIDLSQQVQYLLNEFDSIFGGVWVRDRFTVEWKDLIHGHDCGDYIESGAICDISSRAHTVGKLNDIKEAIPCQLTVDQSQTRWRLG